MITKVAKFIKYQGVIYKIVDVNELEKEELREIIDGIVDVPKEIIIREPKGLITGQARGNYCTPL